MRSLAANTVAPSRRSGAGSSTVVGLPGGSLIPNQGGGRDHRACSTLDHAG